MAKETCPYGSWSAVNDKITVLAEQERKRMSMPWRIWEISVARANNWGHAAFRTGELAKLCCGEDSPANRTTVHRGMKTLAEMGRIAPMADGGSTQYCVMVNREYVWRGAGKGGRNHVCSEPSHMDIKDTPWPADAESTTAEDSDDPWAHDPA